MQMSKYSDRFGNITDKSTLRTIDQGSIIVQHHEHESQQRMKEAPRIDGLIPNVREDLGTALIDQSPAKRSSIIGS